MRSVLHGERHEDKNPPRFRRRFSPQGRSGRRTLSCEHVTPIAAYGDVVALSCASSRSGRVPSGSLIAVVKLIAEGVTGQALVLFEVGTFGRLIMALDRLGRPMWCSRSPVSGSIAFMGSALTAPSS